MPVRVMVAAWLLVPALLLAAPHTCLTPKELSAYRVAAEHGNAAAQTTLGMCYHIGEGGVKCDYGLALAWYGRAAAQGHPVAQYGLGLMFMNGRGMAPDPVRAAFWFRKAAAQGLSLAQDELETMNRRRGMRPPD